ncbi:response regulator [Candidatus Entotheonella palauensis]|nr:response regulator [Candidatus Entotheonella palauensis]
MMMTPLRMLLLDRRTNADIIIDTLRQAGFVPAWQCVQTESDYLAHLRDSIEMIVAAYALPQLPALRALELLRERGLDIPLIIIADRLREDQVVAGLKQGAADYVVKQRLERLGPAVSQALRDKMQSHGEPERPDKAEALRASEGRLQLLIAKNVDGVVVINRHGVIRFANPAAEKLFARPAMELVGEPFGFPMVVGETTELDIVRRGSNLVVAEMRVVETEWEGEAAYLASLRDISERKRAEEMLRQQGEQLRQARNMETVGQLAGGMAHEFNNLLTAILGYSDLLQKYLANMAHLHGYAKQISDVAHQAASLVQQLLAFARQQVLKPQILNCNNIVHETQDMLRSSLGDQIELINHLEPHLGLIEADPIQLQQVLLNLLVNARDAMPEGGKLRVSTANVDLNERHQERYLNAPPGTYMRLTVSDTGEGMEPDVMSRLFEPFFTTKEVGKGMGLGLAVVYGIVQQNRGDIEIRSAPAAGTTVHIYLPHVARASEPVALPKPAAEAPSGSETVLLVEDDHIVRLLIRSTLELKGYDVLDAADAEEAIRLCEQRDASIDLLVTDVVMPGMNGPALAAHLTSFYPEMRALLISGYSLDNLRTNAAADAAIAFLSKPFTMDELADRVRVVLDNSPADV